MRRGVAAVVVGFTALAALAALADDPPAAPAARIPTTAFSCPADASPAGGPAAPGHLVVPLGLPSPWIPPSNPLTAEKIALGTRLFYETAMSRDGTKSCAHCHLPEIGLGDGRPTAIGVRGQIGPRNVPTLWNAAIYPVLFWDGRAVSLEAQAEGPLLAPTELDVTEDLLVERISGKAEYAPLFEKAFGSKTVTLRRIAYALSSFERTLLAADAPFDRWWFGKQKDAISEPARRGYELFRTKAGCAGCHSVRPAEAAFSDFEFHSTGTVAEGSTDLGRMAVTGVEADRGRFRTPTLRNVALTAPYFHDGSAKTLADVVEHYDKGGKPVGGRAPEIAALHLTAAEKSDLLQFLDALTSPAARAAFVPGASADALALLESAEDAPDPGAVRIAAEDVLERSPKSTVALRALLVATGRLNQTNLLDDAIERAHLVSLGPPLDPSLSTAIGSALLRRARLEEPPNTDFLGKAAALLAPSLAPGGRPRDALDLAYARHLLGDVPGATTAYERALDGDETLGELALAGLMNLVGAGADAARRATALEELGRRRPVDPVVLRARADALFESGHSTDALTLLLGAKGVVARSPRTAVRLATMLRDVERYEEAIALEHKALDDGARDAQVLAAIEANWRAPNTRPLASFADVDALLADAERLIAVADAMPGDRYVPIAYRNDFAFRLRDLVASFSWRGEARTQALADGAPKEARLVLEHVVKLYEDAAALIPADAAGRPFPYRWTYAAILNDAALMRHYWLDVRDLEKAEALYLRAFELTDGAYMDTYFYNLQYLFGFERPGREDLWYRVARRASEAILKEGPNGTYVPDEGKREAARRDAEALKKVLDEREASAAMR